MRAVLEAHIRAAGGWLDFERYMDLALYAPGLGYYSAGTCKLGEHGDFVTAPEISPIFGGCIARQCADVLPHCAAPQLLEIGAGTGRLAVDVLRRLETLQCLPAHYDILEISADLRARQRALIAREVPTALCRVRWLDRPPLAPFEGVVLANEVLDALPVARFCWTAGGVLEWGVELGAAGWRLACRAARAHVASSVETIRAQTGARWPEGYSSEVCPRMAPWTREVCASLRRGVALWIDYGLPRAQYYLPERSDGTLIAHSRHRVVQDLLHRPGLTDLTAWVDFTALAEAGEAAGWRIEGLTSQAHFLAALGLEEELRARMRSAPSTAASEARRLVLPGEMGERFKVMAWCRQFDQPLRGFSQRDLLPSL